MVIELHSLKSSAAEHYFQIPKPQIPKAINTSDKNRYDNLVCKLIITSPILTMIACYDLFSMLVTTEMCQLKYNLTNI